MGGTTNPRRSTRSLNQITHLVVFLLGINEFSKPDVRMITGVKCMLASFANCRGEIFEVNVQQCHVVRKSAGSITCRWYATGPARCSGQLVSNVCGSISRGSYLFGSEPAPHCRARSDIYQVKHGSIDRTRTRLIILLHTFDVYDASCSLDLFIDGAAAFHYVDSS